MRYNQRRSEATEQELVVDWCNLRTNRVPELALLYHIPNGGSRNMLEAKNLKRQGVKAGVPDLCLPVPRGTHPGLYLEMKYGKNKTTSAQNWWLEQLKAQGYMTAVCYGAEEAIQTISEYMGIEGREEKTT